MNLDNGIMIKVEKDFKAPFWVKLDFYNGINRDLAEICYWRKCYNIRDKILAVIRYKDSEEKSFEYKLTSFDIKRIRQILKYFTNEKVWYNEGDNYWEWDEIKWRLVRQQMNLYWLERYMKKHDIEVYFYDSY